ncbi:MAG: hypothetical protein LBL15_00460 [Oscillospiraceae bacterium]|jgi:hypothetical protein|nr:hypothetical protein [Oscillospiraceae bacterium]
MSLFKRRRANAASVPDTPPQWYRSLPGRLLEAWPKQDEKPEAPAFLKHCTSVDMEDEMLIGLLSAYDIPSVRRYPANGGFGLVVLGMSGEGADIYVPASRLDEAAALIGGMSDDELHG